MYNPCGGAEPTRRSDIMADQRKPIVALVVAVLLAVVCGLLACPQWLPWWRDPFFESMDMLAEIEVALLQQYAVSGAFPETLNEISHEFISVDVRRTLENPRAERIPFYLVVDPSGLAVIGFSGPNRTLDVDTEAVISLTPEQAKTVFLHRDPTLEDDIFGDDLRMWVIRHTYKFPADAE
jgi:hypothetical protein